MIRKILSYKAAAFYLGISLSVCIMIVITLLVSTKYEFAILLIYPFLFPWHKLVFALASKLNDGYGIVLVLLIITAISINTALLALVSKAIRIIRTKI